MTVVRALSGPVEAAQLHLVAARIPVEVEVAILVGQVIEARQALVQRRAPFLSTQFRGRFELQLRVGENAERAEGNAQRAHEVGIPLAGEAAHVTRCSDEPAADQRHRQVVQRAARSVRPGADRTAYPLRRDVAEIGHRQPDFE